jgi:hypothetical protein
MTTIMPAEMPLPGFSFENCKRNAFLAQSGFKPPKVIAAVAHSRLIVFSS